MRIHFPKIVANKLIQWLMQDTESLRQEALSDFERIQYEIRHCDVLLIEGRSRVARAISLVTQSIWSHAGLYIGRLYDIKDTQMREWIAGYYQGDADIPLVVESILGKGVVVSPLTQYQHEHIRICRPMGLSSRDAKKVIEYAVSKLGIAYDIRQIFDLWRFMIPWGIFPRRWRSSLFSRQAGESTRFSCSLLLVEAFSSVNFPILPIVSDNAETGIEFARRNPRLYTPSDFDYSPFFQ
ncbi:MAG: YiiX/YebB-like N1pC/P60 family cysteine hydrolase, partial [Gammaproteobacteria bacterium]